MRPRLRDVAEAAGVSTSLASFALNGARGSHRRRGSTSSKSPIDWGTRPTRTPGPSGRAATGRVGLVIRNLANPTILETAMSAGSTYEATLRLLRDHAEVTALIANSDHAVNAVYEATRKAGVRIGRDLSVIGQDDLATSRLLDPPLTTIRLDRRALGKALVARLIDGGGLGDHREPVDLVVRGSTGPPGPSPSR